MSAAAASVIDGVDGASVDDAVEAVFDVTFWDVCMKIQNGELRGGLWSMVPDALVEEYRELYHSVCGKARMLEQLDQTSAWPAVVERVLEAHPSWRLLALSKPLPELYACLRRQGTLMLEGFHVVQCECISVADMGDDERATIAGVGGSGVAAEDVRFRPSSTTSRVLRPVRRWMQENGVHDVHGAAVAAFEDPTVAGKMLNAATNMFKMFQ